MDNLQDATEHLRNMRAVASEKEHANDGPTGASFWHGYGLALDEALRALKDVEHWTPLREDIAKKTGRLK